LESVYRVQAASETGGTIDAGDCRKVCDLVALTYEEAIPAICSCVMTTAILELLIIQPPGERGKVEEDVDQRPPHKATFAYDLQRPSVVDLDH
jgi:hypothetical protein